MLYIFLCNVIMMNMQLERFKTDIIPLRQTLFAVALKWLQQEEDAEDATQETLLRLWNIRGQLDAVANPGAFAVQIVKNICIDRLRAQKEKTTVDDFIAETDHETPYTEIERKDAVALVKRIIERLPVSQQTIIRMRDIEGYGLQEIAEITGTQISAVTVNLSRARKNVRNQYMKIMNYRLWEKEKQT